MIKKFSLILLAFALLIMPVSTHAENRIMDFGVQLGSWAQEDETVLKTFDSDFFINGHIGIMDLGSGLELRAAIGRYDNQSHHGDDVGTNTTLRVIPITGSIIYNTASDWFLRPYVGGGVGNYFYTIQNDTFGNIESKSRFGAHLLTGFKVHLNPSTYFRVEYAYHFVPNNGSVFQNADHFNQSSIVLGMGFLFNAQRSQRNMGVQAAQVDPLAEQVKSLSNEIDIMKQKRTEIEGIIEAFYTRSDFQVTTDLLSALNRNLPVEGGELSVIDPKTRETKIKGMISSLKTINRATTEITLKQNQWTTKVVITRSPFKVIVGDEEVFSINAANADKSLLVTTVQNSDEFGRELTKVNYYENRLGVLNKQIKDAQDEFQKLSAQYEKRREQIIGNNGPQTTIIYQDDFMFRTPFNNFDNRFRFYNPPFYVAPVFVPTAPPQISSQQREQYIEKKKEYIQNFRNR